MELTIRNMVSYITWNEDRGTHTWELKTLIREMAEGKIYTPQDGIYCWLFI